MTLLTHWYAFPQLGWPPLSLGFWGLLKQALSMFHACPCLS